MQKKGYSSPRSSTRLTKALLILIWVLIIALVCALGYLFFIKAQSLDGANSAKSSDSYIDKTALLTVYDKTYEDEVSPAFILLNFDSKSGVVSVAAIPSDTLAGVNSKKMTVAEHYEYGGIVQAVQAVDELCGIKTDYYAAIDSTLLTDVTDVMGAVEFEIDEDMYTKSESGTLICDIKKGKQSLTGQQLTEFFRYGGWDDNTRAKKQSALTAAMINEYSNDEMADKLSELFGKTAAELRTNISVIQISELCLAYDSFTVNKNTAQIIDVTSSKGVLDDKTKEQLADIF